MKKNLYVDVHVLQIVPPSCINRDDTGSPKSAVYGGVTRARVSSQCWKKAVRDMFRDMLASEDVGIRTKKIVDMVADEIKKIGGINAVKAAQDILKEAGLKLKEDKDKVKDMESGALFFLSPAQAKALAELTMQKLDKKDLKKAAQKALNDNPTLDIALFGRMVADDPSLNTDASAQVAHSISTHKVNNEYDYFTALDDMSPADNAGAGMLGTVEYNSSTLYRYATVAVHALHEQLQDDTAEAVANFVNAFVCAMPTGKINTFANRTLPSAVMVTIRKDQPINLVGAFENPVKASDNGYMEGSCKALIKHAQITYKDWLDAPAVSLVIGDELEALGDKVNLKTLLSRLQNEINDRL